MLRVLLQLLSEDHKACGVFLMIVSSLLQSGSNHCGLRRGGFYGRSR